LLLNKLEACWSQAMKFLFWIGVVLVISWALLWLGVKIAIGAVHLLLLAGVILIGWGLLRQGHSNTPLK